ncbi:uncharacterized protein LOC127258595 [Andrographis paniculata]|uniref:uncharacterized protein LOC127258595 n=1 Tax=Andrographis paniculata TaxID=175694 RepID=UPI0021E7AACB|nr:uncharacterized protein LOC127258595 [Andrographis paniculata]
MPGELRDEFDKDARRMKQELARNFVASIGGMEEESPKDGRSKDVAALVGGTQNVSTENAESKDLADLVGGTKNISTEKGELKDVAALVGGTKNVSTENEELKDVAASVGGTESESTESGGSKDAAASVGGTESGGSKGVTGWVRRTERGGLTDVFSEEGKEEDESSLYGFEREEMYKIQLEGTVRPYQRHFFLCHRTYDTWPVWFNQKSADLLPQLFTNEHLMALSKAPMENRLTICERNKFARIYDGDVLIFPDMHVYRRMKPAQIRGFVDEVMIRGKRWSSGELEELTGSYIFICAHKFRDRRCGACGPALIKKFNQVIEAKDLKRKVFVMGCSHTGGNRNSGSFAGNVIIFSRDSKGKIAGNWYGYVTPKDVLELVEKQIIKGEIVERLWRGQMDTTTSKYDYSSEALLDSHNPPKRNTSWIPTILLGIISAATIAYGIYRRR